MAEKLIIKNFSCIKDLEIDVKPITILIGPQATGKSVVAKLLYYFRGFLHDSFGYLMAGHPVEMIGASFFGRIMIDFLSLEGDKSSSWDKSPFRIRYEIDDSFIELEWDGAKPRLSHSDDYTEKINEFNDMRKKNINNPDLPKIAIEEPFNLRLPIFIPAGRSFFALLQKNVFSFLSSENNIDRFLTEFGRFYEMAKNNLYAEAEKAKKGLYFPGTSKRFLGDVNKILAIIIGCKYDRKPNGEDFLIHEDGRVVNIANCSSGQQEILPLIIALLVITDLIRCKTIYIEEPEAHLFPTAQKDIVELMAKVYNSGSNMSLFITTHSPYILTAFNNLMEAGIVEANLIRDIKKKKELKKLYKIVPQEKILKPQRVSAYSLGGGTGKSIIDKKTGLVLADAIDDVSEELAIQFDKLLGMKYA